MKTNTLRVSLLLFSGFLLFLASCAEVKSNSELLTGPSWKFNSISNPDLDQDAIDFFTAIFEGMKQDYATDGTYFIDFPDSSLGEDYSGTWELATDDVTITIDKGSTDEGTYSIVDLTETIFTFSYQDSTGTNTFNFTAVE